MYIKRIIKDTIIFVLFLLPIIIISFAARYKKKVKVGLGPEPLINNVYHKKAMNLAGYDAETFVYRTYYITKDFDKIFSNRRFKFLLIYLYIIFNYKIIYIYFNGGPLAWSPFAKFEPFFYKLSRVRVVVMPYGGDVQDFNVNNDIVYKSSYYLDYPIFVKNVMKNVNKNVKRWIKHSDYIISGCDWVNYMPYWDKLTLGHFSIDTELWSRKNEFLKKQFSKDKPLKILHAPNHKAIKGTEFIVKTINKLKNQGYPIELECVENMPNHILRDYIDKFDIVVEQMVIGWYGIFALECMTKGIPVMTYISKDLEKLYIINNLLDLEELPVINIDYNNFESKLIDILNNKIDLKIVSDRSINYVNKHHSIRALADVFNEINNSIMYKRGI